MKSKRNIYTRAAKRVSSGKEVYSCNAVCTESMLLGKDERRLYARAMSPRAGFTYSSALQPCGLLVGDVRNAVSDWSFGNGEALVNFRVWLLCMMAAACDDLDDDPLEPKISV